MSEMSNQQNEPKAANEAADRLRKHIDQAASRDGYADIMQRDLDAALATERRNVVAEIRERFTDHDPFCAFVRFPGGPVEPPDPCTCGYDAIRALLDELEGEDR